MNAASLTDVLSFSTIGFPGFPANAKWLEPAAEGAGSTFMRGGVSLSCHNNAALRISMAGVMGAMF